MTATWLMFDNGSAQLLYTIKIMIGRTKSIIQREIVAMVVSVFWFKGYKNLFNKNIIPLKITAQTIEIIPSAIRIPSPKSSGLEFLSIDTFMIARIPTMNNPIAGR